MPIEINVMWVLFAVFGGLALSLLIALGGSND